MEAQATTDLIDKSHCLLSAKVLEIRRGLIDTILRNSILNYVPQKNTIEVVDKSPALLFLVYGDCIPRGHRLLEKGRRKFYRAL